MSPPVQRYRYNGALSDVSSASVLEQWAYWIKNSSEHIVEELQELLPGLEFLRATGELNAIREITEEKQMYDAREKASLDIQSNLIDARQEGRQEGREEGRQEGRQEGIEIGEKRGEQRGDRRGKLKASIQIYEGLLGDSVTSEITLNSRSTEELESMVANLQKRLRDRTS